MKKEELGKFRIIWWVVLGIFILLTLLVFYVYGPRAAAAAEVGLWKGASPAGYAAWIFGGIGALFAVAGARLGRGLFLPGWRFAEKLASKAREKGRSNTQNPAFAVYILALGLIQCTAFIGVMLYIRTGSFNSFIVSIGMALLGWLVVKPEAEKE